MAAQLFAVVPAVLAVAAMVAMTVLKEDASDGVSPTAEAEYGIVMLQVSSGSARAGEHYKTSHHRAADGKNSHAHKRIQVVEHLDEATTPQGYEIRITGDCYGNNIGGADVSLNDCAAGCSSMGPTCVGFSYSTKMSRCERKGATCTKGETSSNTFQFYWKKEETKKAAAAAAPTNQCAKCTGCAQIPAPNPFTEHVQTNCDGGIADKHCYRCGAEWRNFPSKCPEECMNKCIALGTKCTGFVRLSNGVCYFRQGAPVITGKMGGRDCYIKSLNATTAAPPATAAPVADGVVDLGNLGFQAYKVSIGDGQCDGDKIETACKAKGMTPLCDSSAWRAKKGGKCYHPATDRTHKLFKARFSVPSDMGTVFRHAGMDPKTWKPYGMVFYAPVGSLGNALYATAPRGHVWCGMPGSGRMGPIPENQVPSTARGGMIHVRDVNAGKVFGGWHTLCVKEKPNPPR